jgi:purine-nucleoside phosphorylase
MSTSPLHWLSAALDLIPGQITPRIALILGSGLGGVAAEIEVASSIPYREIPGFPVSTAIGHKGQLTLGHFAGVPVAVMEGRFHRYEGYPAEQITRPIELLRALGVETLIATNAAGGLNPDFGVGDVVVIRDHVNLMGPQSLGPARTAGPLGDRGLSAIRPDYDPDLAELTLDAIRQAGGRELSGTYIGMTGPNYETRAEYRFLRQIGDLVGMSTVPEVIAARSLGMRAVGLSVVSNACNPDQLEPTDGAQVVAAVSRAAGLVGTTLRQLIPRIG